MKNLKRRHSIEFLEDTLEKIQTKTFEESQVIVHCNYHNDTPFESGIRIWESTLLFDHQTNNISKLIHIENIPIYPNWKIVNANSSVRFTLYFSALSKACKQFDLLEVIPQSNGFEVLNIDRNDSDVYQVIIT